MTEQTHSSKILDQIDTKGTEAIETHLENASEDFTDSMPEKTKIIHSSQFESNSSKSDFPISQNNTPNGSSQKLQTIQGKNGTYTLLEKIGGGGMGTTFKATYTPNNQTTGENPLEVCAKRFRFGSRREDLLTGKNKKLELFLREGDILKILDDELFTKCYETISIPKEFNENDEWIMMEYVKGESLDKIQKTLSQKNALTITSKVLAALKVLHAKKIVSPSGEETIGVYHRDIKPENILLQEDGTVRIVDLGSVALSYDNDSFNSTTTGSSSYTAFEQFTSFGTDKNFAPADVFSTGATLAYLLTGKAPVINPDIDYIELPKEFPEELRNLVKDMTHNYHRKKRIQTAKDARERLEKIIEKDKKITESIPYESKEESIPKNNIQKKKLNYVDGLLFPFALAHYCRIHAQGDISSLTEILGILTSSVLVIPALVDKFGMKVAIASSLTNLTSTIYTLIQSKKDSSKNKKLTSPAEIKSQTILHEREKITDVIFSCYTLEQQMKEVRTYAKEGKASLCFAYSDLIKSEAENRGETINEKELQKLKYQSVEKKYFGDFGFLKRRNLDKKVTEEIKKVIKENFTEDARTNALEEMRKYCEEHFSEGEYVDFDSATTGKYRKYDGPFPFEPEVKQYFTDRIVKKAAEKYITKEMKKYFSDTNWAFGPIHIEPLKNFMHRIDLISKNFNITIDKKKEDKIKKRYQNNYAESGERFYLETY